MTLEQEIEDFVNFFGMENLPSPEHEPKRFEFYVRAYRYHKSRQSEKTM